METSLKCVWFTATRTIGTRRLGRWASSMGPYRDTVFSFPDVKGYVALTIDDGLCRNAGCSLAKEVLELLQKHDARATFFICSDYLSGCEEEAFALLGAGHEFANHLTADRVNYYHKLKPEKLQAELRKASEAIHALNGQVKWFRAPQGRMTNSMKTLVAEEGMRHAIGDAYCDDWCISDDQFVASTLLRQVCAIIPGSTATGLIKPSCTCAGTGWLDHHHAHAGAWLPRAHPGSHVQAS